MALARPTTDCRYPRQLPSKGLPLGSVMSQYMRMTRPSVGRQGSTAAVSGSGHSTRSLSSTFMNPAMELPSKQMPCWKT